MSTLPGIELRPIGLDDFSQVRQIHAQAFRTFLACDLSEDQIDALLEFVHTPQYTQLLLQSECVGAWLNDRLCATGSWTPGGPASDGAKLMGICVDPLFSGLGIARRLVHDIEARARRAGFSTLSARAPVTMAPFFVHLGYAGTSRGVWAIPCGVTLPVLHMRKASPARPVLIKEGQQDPMLESMITSVASLPN